MFFGFGKGEILLIPDYTCFKLFLFVKLFLKFQVRCVVWEFGNFFFTNKHPLHFVITFYLLWIAEALASQVTQENFDKGLIYPPFANIRKISACIAANVAAKAYELGDFPFQ